MKLARASGGVWARRYRHESPAGVLPCDVWQPDMRPLLARRAGIIVPGSGASAHADLSTLGASAPAISVRPE
jgi:hypothetical protein